MLSPASTSMSASTNDVAYWYKGHIMLPSGLPCCIEGGIPARNAGAALSEVKEMSAIWNKRSINTIYIYTMTDGGVIPDEPDIVWYNGRYPTYIKGVSEVKDLVVRDQKPFALEPDQLSLSDYYEAQSWTTIHKTATYPTVMIKGAKP